jgi:hypothetical protein
MFENFHFLPTYIHIINFEKKVNYIPLPCTLLPLYFCDIQGIFIYLVPLPMSMYLLPGPLTLDVFSLGSPTWGLIVVRGRAEWGRVKVVSLNNLVTPLPTMHQNTQFRIQSLLEPS